MKLAAIIFATACASCATVADTTYAGQLASCVDRAKTKPEADACRAEVDKRWCVVDGSPQCVSEGGAK